jgi:hypothetical protein
LGGGTAAQRFALKWEHLGTPHDAQCQKPATACSTKISHDRASPKGCEP